MAAAPHFVASVYGDGHVTGGTASKMINCYKDTPAADCTVQAFQAVGAAFDAIEDGLSTFDRWDHGDSSNNCRAAGSTFPNMQIMFIGAEACKAIFKDPLSSLPSITSFMPSSAAVGGTVEVVGAFDGANVDNILAKFGGIDAVVDEFTTDRGGVDHIKTKVPTGAMTGKIEITTPGGTALSASDFTVTTPGPSCEKQLGPNMATIAPQMVAAAAGSTTSHAVTLTVNVKNPTTAPMTVQFAQVFYPGGAAHCTAGPGPATVVNPTEIAPGATGVATITQSVNITIAPNFTGSCLWLCNLDLTTTCGLMQTSISGNFRATF